MFVVLEMSYSDVQPWEIAVHLVVICLFGVCSFFTFSYSSVFAYHPFGMLLGYGVLLSEAILLSRKIVSKRRKFWLQVHATMQFLGFFLILVGFVTIVYSKVSRNKQHFKSWHALIGLGAFTLTAVQILIGIVIYYQRKLLVQKFGSVLAIRIARLHGKSGAITYAISMVALALGFKTNYAVSTFSENFATFLLLATLLITLVVIFAPTKITEQNTNALNS